jgi:hypothetical protein
MQGRGAEEDHDKTLCDQLATTKSCATNQLVTTDLLQ